ncbi:glycosyl transferase family 2 [Actinophytocola oryzae]|uniref:Glycosyl transferase family 2 n=2 Tax=Actinophytocola oryzae TaxID=502181 RepID=A0A4R7VMY5_9PSEU|nr:glycosyl transferase family 2 [Actinophytocola oryzae]
MLPAYGDNALVRETIGSVVAQEDPRWRLTVIDDAPGDLKSFVAELGHEKVRYLPNERRLGINRNFQRCVDEATADLVMLIGADDRLLPDFVSRVHAAAEQHPDAALFHTNAIVIDEHGNPAMPLADRIKRLVSIKGGVVTGGERLAASLLHGNWMYFPSVVFRRDVLRKHGFREGYDIVLDLDLYLRILLDGGRVVLFDRPGIEYRRHAASLSSSTAGTGARFDEERNYFAETAAAMAAAGWPRAARAARWHLTSRMHAAAKALAARKGAPPA